MASLLDVAQLLATRHAFRCAHELSHLVVATVLLLGVGKSGHKSNALFRIWSPANLRTAVCGTSVSVPEFRGTTVGYVTGACSANAMYNSRPCVRIDLFASTTLWPLTAGLQ